MFWRSRFNREPKTVKTQSGVEMTGRFVAGFTLVEAMVALTLGLGLMALMVGTIENVFRASRVSAEAAEATERGYFLMDALGAWVAETSPSFLELMLSEHKAIDSSTLIDADHAGAVSPTDPIAKEAESFERTLKAAAELPASPASTGKLYSIDPCQTPLNSGLPLVIAGIGVLESRAWSCIPQSHLVVSAPALFLERRIPCHGACNDAGFYAIPIFCLDRYEGRSTDFRRGEVEADELETVELAQYHLVWLEADEDRPDCFRTGTARSVHRSLIYVRDYSWRVGDGIKAVMMRELAQEQDTRWLRSAMLAYGIDDWQIECLSICVEVEPWGEDAVLATAIDLRFAVRSRSQSIDIRRVLTPQGP